MFSVISRTLVGEVLLLCIKAVGVFYSPSLQGKIFIWPQFARRNFYFLLVHFFCRQMAKTVHSASKIKTFFRRIQAMPNRRQVVRFLLFTQQVNIRKSPTAILMRHGISSLSRLLRSFFLLLFYHYYYCSCFCCYLRVFHISFSCWTFPWVWVTASLLKSFGDLSIYWQILIML